MLYSALKIMLNLLFQIYDGIFLCSLFRQREE